MAVSVRRFITSRYITHYLSRDVYFIPVSSFTNSVSPSKEQSQLQTNYMKKKFSDLMAWYEDVTGLAEVRIAQNRVLEAEQNFINAQERRREASNELSAIQIKLKELHSELDTTSRGEERYVQIITQEHRVLQEEKRVRQELQRYEREERDDFASLSMTVKDSHEKERAQAEKTKYWSIIGSIIGTLLGIAGSSINNEIKMRQLRRLVQESLVNKGNTISSKVPDALTKHETELSGLVNQMKIVANQPNDRILGRLDDLIQTLDNKQLFKDNETSLRHVLDCIKDQEKSCNKQFDELKAVVRSQSIGIQHLQGDQIVVMPVGLEERLSKQNKEMCYLVVFTSVFVVTVPMVLKYFGFS